MEKLTGDSKPLRQIGPYQLIRKLGQGGMSRVFLVQDEQEQYFALKLLNLNLEAEPEFRQRFLREAEITQHLNHPNIVKTLAWQDDPEIGVYLIMEYISGGNLRSHLEGREKPWTVEQCLELFTPIAAALDYAHQEKVIHRDLKPENLLFHSDNSLKIADFGVAKIDQGTRLTRSGVLPGTPEYMAPEQFSDLPVGPAADIYGLATIIYECLTGTTPFRSDNLAQILQRQAFDSPMPPTRLREELPSYTDRVLLKALAKKPEQRHLSAGELLKDLANPSTTLISRTDSADDNSQLPTRYVNYKPVNNPAQKTLPWIIIAIIWTAAALAWCWRSLPAAATASWTEQALGWQPCPIGQQLCASVLWCGIEVTIFNPTQNTTALERARFAAGMWEDWLERKSPLDLSTVKASETAIINTALGEWVTVDAQMAVNLRATPEQIAKYWTALLKDVQAIGNGKAPNAVKEVERHNPVRLDGTPPRYLLLDRLYDRSRIQDREGDIEAEIIIEALSSLGSVDSRRLQEAARSIPLPKP